MEEKTECCSLFLKTAFVFEFTVGVIELEFLFFSSDFGKWFSRWAIYKLLLLNICSYVC